MNILFMTIGRMENIEDHTIYCDLLRCFRNQGHEVYTLSPYEKNSGKKTNYFYKNGVHMLHAAAGNITGAANILEKGIATISIEPSFIKSIKKYFPDVKFDLVLYSTPPITLCGVIEYVKKRDRAKTYLLLKDIFPQNAVDLGMLKKQGIKGLIYRYFRNKEKRLYAVSDHIGCMSPANMNYIFRQNPDLNFEKVEICPNSIEILNKSICLEEKRKIREKYKLPLEKTIYVYGGNLGKPQGIPFLIKCLQKQQAASAFFLIIGSGTEYGKLENFVRNDRPVNVRLMKYIPQEEYDSVIGACDVGMIFLDHRFTIPNFPSRLLGYMQAGLPVLAVTDTNTDLGQVVVNGGFGWWCESDDTDEFVRLADKITDTPDREQMGEQAFRYLKEHYDVEAACQKILSHYKKAE